MKKDRLWWGLALGGFLAFAVIAWGEQNQVISPANLPVRDRVVLPAVVQAVLVGGDRFLAANLESIRVVATADDVRDGADGNASFAIRARLAVALLNPCHEDNYYYGNALLTWGGMAEQGTELMGRAMNCRGWDELPAFFFGFNQFYFLKNVERARQALEEAARRSTVNAAAMRKLSIMLAAGEIKEETAALEYLRSERNAAQDQKLRRMLDKRIGRLEGLLLLKAAQKLTLIHK